MVPFIERYYRDVTRLLGDPSTSVRYPKADRYADLTALDAAYFSDLLRLGVSHSLIGYAEATVTLATDQSFYPFPPGFRHFLSLQKREADTGRIIQALGTGDYFEPSYHIDILDAESGFRIHPAPTDAMIGEWTLCYQRSPGVLHYAKAHAVSPNSIVGLKPDEDAGEIILSPNYYNGMRCRIVQASTGEGQQMLIQSSNQQSGKLALQLSRPFDIVPTGDITYELCPTLPLACDKLYAVEAVIEEWGSVRKQPVPPTLIQTKERLRSTAKTFFGVTTLDRPPMRVSPYNTDHSVFSPEIGW